MEQKKKSKVAVYALAGGGVVILLLLLVLFVTLVAKSMGGMGSVTLMAQWLDGQTLSLDLETPPPPENGDSIEAGKAIFEMRCIACHGIKGDGKGKRANELKTRPADFTSGFFKWKSTLDPAPTNLDLFKVIGRGLHGTAMLPWPALRPAETWQVVYYIKTLSDLFEENQPKPVNISGPTRSIPSSILLGKKVYEKAKCYECHGFEGRGDGQKAGKLKDYKGLPIKPRNFIEETLKRGNELDEIYLTIATGLNGTPMAAYSKTLSEDEMISLAYYIRSIARKPAGQGMISAAMHMTPDEQMGMMIDHVMKPNVLRPNLNK